MRRVYGRLQSDATDSCPYKGGWKRLLITNAHRLYG